MKSAVSTREYDLIGSTAQGRCPHCSSTARVERSRAFHWRCGVCFGPVVPVEDGQEARAPSELPLLVRAQRLHAMATGWIAGAVVLGATAFMATVLGLLVATVSVLAGAVLFGVATVAAGLAFIAARRGGARRKDRRQCIDDAWRAVATQLLRRRGAMTSVELAQAMGTGAAHAEALLAHLSACGPVRVQVQPDAELRYLHADEADASDLETARRS